MLSEDAAVLLCSGIIVYNALKRYRTSDTQRIGIVGIGGLGHLAIQFAHAMGYHTTVLSTSESKRDECLLLGADDFVCIKEKSAYDNLVERSDLVFCTAHGNVRWGHLFDSMKKRGKIILMGFADMAFNPTDLVVHELSIHGSFVGNRAMMREMLEYTQLHHIKPMVETFPMSQINEAIDRLKNNKARYRIVLFNE